MLPVNYQMIILLFSLIGLGVDGKNTRVRIIELGFTIPRKKFHVENFI